MIRLASRGLLARRVATVLAAAGLLTAVSGFLVLTGVSRTTQAVLSGDIARAWDTPYDLLVRPAGTQTRLEEGEGLVRPNFLSGVTGGITPEQLASIRAVPGVTVAAPIAVVGFVQWPAGFPVDLGGAVGPGPISVLRVTAVASGEGGLSNYPPVSPSYLVAAPQGRVMRETGGGALGAAPTYLEVGGTRIPCTPTVACYGGLTPDVGADVSDSPDGPGLFLGWPVPVVVAGIDPPAEAQLARLDRCVTAGRYLAPSDVPAVAESEAGAQPTIPVLVSVRSFVDETVKISIARAADPSAVLTGAAPETLSAWAPAGERTATADDAYSAYLATLFKTDYYDASPHWTAGSVTYRQVGPDRLEAVTVPADATVYESEVTVRGSARPVSLAPQEAADVWFRSVERSDQVRRGELFSRWTPIGQYDPGCLPGFDPLAGGRLEAYGLPQVALPNGQTLGPTRSLASYVNSPPLVLTTLDSAAWLADSARFAGAPGPAFISAVRIRISGVDEPGVAAESRLAAAAGAIRDQTGLQVDVVKGSSPRQVLIDLPPGRFGRPAITVGEGWSKKGVAVAFVQAVASQDLAIFLLVVVGALLLVADTAYVAVRQRRPELATLRALGWSRRQIAWLVEAEMLVLGFAVGIVALLVIGALLPLGLVLEPWQVLGALPLSVSVAGAAGLVPALLVFRGRPIGHLAEIERTRRSRPPRSVGWFAMRDLLGSRRIETALGALAVALGAGLVGIIALVLAAFNGRLDTTVLGLYLAAQVRPFHVAVALLTLLVGVLAAGEIVSLGYLRRADAFATLRAIGWSPQRVAEFLLVQAAAIGVFGGIAASAGTWAAGWILASAPGPTGIAVGAAFVAAVAATLAAGIGPAALAFRAVPAALLRGE